MNSIQLTKLYLTAIRVDGVRVRLIFLGELDTRRYEIWRAESKLGLLKWILRSLDTKDQGPTCPHTRVDRRHSASQRIEKPENFPFRIKIHDHGKGSRYSKCKSFLLNQRSDPAAPGLVVIVLPIILISEAIYWIESFYVRADFGIPAPVIALMIAAVIAIVTTNLVDLPKRYQSGLSFSTRWLLRSGIVLYGLNFSYSLWLKPGAQWIFVIGVVSVIVPLIAAYFLGKLFHLGEKLKLLVAVGTGICGISAIIATQQAIKSDEESAGMALATILAFGTIVLFLYPVLDGIFSFNSTNLRYLDRRNYA